ncbi:hypothetical protein, partial [Vibrio anguillarum]
MYLASLVDCRFFARPLLHPHALTLKARGRRFFIPSFSYLIQHSVPKKDKSHNEQMTNDGYKVCCS